METAALIYCTRGNIFDGKKDLHAKTKTHTLYILLLVNCKLGLEIVPNKVKLKTPSCISETKISSEPIVEATPSLLWVQS